MANMPLLVVAAALVDGDGRVLVQQRPRGKQHGGLWEFPGGKVEPGEPLQAALARELHEELGIAVESSDVEPLAFSTPDHGEQPIVLLLYRVRRWTGVAVALDAAAIRWIEASELTKLAMPPADLPLVAALARELAAGKAEGSDSPPPR